MSLHHEVFKALQKKELTATEKGQAIAQAEEAFGGRAAGTRADIVAELHAKPEPKKAAAKKAAPKKKDQSKSTTKRKASLRSRASKALKGSK